MHSSTRGTPASAADGGKQFHNGDEVVIVGLTGGAQWNSSHARIHSYSDGRYLVDIVGKQKQLRVKEVNLRSRQSHEHALLVKDRFVATIKAFVAKVNSADGFSSSVAGSGSKAATSLHAKQWLFDLILEEIRLEKELQEHRQVLEDSGDGVIMAAVTDGEAELHEIRLQLENRFQTFCVDFLQAKNVPVGKPPSSSSSDPSNAPGNASSSSSSEDPADKDQRPQSGVGVAGGAAENGFLSESDRRNLGKLEDINDQIETHSKRLRALMDDFAVAFAKEQFSSGRDSFASSTTTSNGHKDSVAKSLKELRGIKVSLNKLQCSKDSMFPLSGSDITDEGRRRIYELRSKVQERVDQGIDRLDRLIPDHPDPRTPAPDKTRRPPARAQTQPRPGRPGGTTKEPANSGGGNSTKSQRPSTTLEVSDSWNNFQVGTNVQLVTPLPKDHVLRKYEGCLATVLQRLGVGSKATQAVEAVSSVKSLKERLTALHVPFDDCVEKKHLKDRYLSTQTRYRVAIQRRHRRDVVEEDILSAYLRLPGEHEVQSRSSANGAGDPPSAQAKNSRDHANDAAAAAAAAGSSSRPEGKPFGRTNSAPHGTEPQRKSSQQGGYGQHNAGNNATGFGFRGHGSEADRGSGSGSGRDGPHNVRSQRGVSDSTPFSRSQSMPAQSHRPRQQQQQQQQPRLPGVPINPSTEKMPDSLKVHFDLPQDMGSPTATHIRLRITGPGVTGAGITHAQLPPTAATAPAGSRRFNYTFPHLLPSTEYRVEVCCCNGEMDRNPGPPLVVIERTSHMARRAYDNRYSYDPMRATR